MKTYEAFRSFALLAAILFVIGAYDLLKEGAYIAGISLFFTGLVFCILHSAE